MVLKVRMPRVDANIEEGTIGRWLVACGQPVRAGRPLVEIITDKAAFELEAEQDGVLRAQVAPTKSVVPVGYVIALVGADADEPLPDVADENEVLLVAYRRSLVGGLAQPEGASGDAAAIENAPAPSVPKATQATPAARRLADETGVSLDDLASRVRGVIRRSDVEDELRRRKGESGQ